MPWLHRRQSVRFFARSLALLDILIDVLALLHGCVARGPACSGFEYDLHFWLGHATSQDEAGIAAYKAVELDQALGDKPVQYREVEGSESVRACPCLSRCFWCHAFVLHLSSMWRPC